MQSNFASSIALVLKSEGGYVDDPRDNGGATNMGITLATLSAARGDTVSKADVHALSLGEAMVIYRANYWNKIKGDQLPSGVDLAVLDYAVNSGPRKGVQALQIALGVPADGVIGPATLAAAQKADAATVIAAICEERLRFLRSLGTYGVFGAGWSARVARIRTAALGMAVASTPMIQPAPVPATPRVIKAALVDSGSRTINAADLQNKVYAVSGTVAAGTGIVASISNVLQSIPPWGYAVLAIAVIAGLYLLTHRIILARIEDALTGANTGRDIGLVPAAAAPAPEAQSITVSSTTAVTSSTTISASPAADPALVATDTPEPAPAVPDANAGQTDAVAADPAAVAP